MSDNHNLAAAAIALAIKIAIWVLIALGVIAGAAAVLFIKWLIGE